MHAERAADLAHPWRAYLYDLDEALAAGDVDLFAAIQGRAEAIARAEGTPPLVIVDYMQMLATTDPDRRRLGVSDVALRLRRMAGALDTPILAVSSVSRAFYGRAGGASRKDADGSEDPRAWLAAAKESGDVEFAAAVVLYLDTSPTEGADGCQEARIIIAKARAGRVGFAGLRFNGPRGSFVEDAAALAKMGAGKRAQDDEARVQAALAATRQHPRPWRDLRGEAGIAKGRADAALARLTSAGRVTTREVIAATAKSRRVQRWTILADWNADALPIGYEEAAGTVPVPVCRAQEGT